MLGSVDAKMSVPREFMQMDAFDLLDASVYVPRVSHNHIPLPCQEALLDQQAGLSQAPIKLLLVPLVPEHMRFWGCTSKVKSLFSPIFFPAIKSCRPSKPKALGGFISYA